MRQPRQILPNIPHHFIVRGNNRRRLFSYNWQYRKFLKLVAYARMDHQIGIHAMAIMPNHVHFVATPPSKDAAAGFIKSFSQRFAQVRNLYTGGSGKLFEERYYSEPLENEAALAVVTAYVELNPVRAGICRTAIEGKWTTYGLHVGLPAMTEIPETHWKPSPWYESLAPTPALRHEVYADFVEAFQQRPAIAKPVKYERHKPPVQRRLRRPNETRVDG
jgi:putative transposase